MSDRVLYLTADAVGASTGGGVVTANESRALGQISELVVWSFPDAPRPWGADDAAYDRLLVDESFRPRLAHLYSGTFTKTVALLKERGCRVTYTCAAHDVNISRAEYERFGFAFDYPHLTDPALWDRYVEGYRRADVVICPSELSAKIVRAYGCEKVVVIPHGSDAAAAALVPMPKRFSVAYLGQPGPDKGLVYLLEAWKIIGYSGSDALLTIAGRGTEQIIPLVRQIGGGSVYVRGAVDDVNEVYDACALYVQPSATEGFGIEVLEAMGRGRVVLCSDGAGARDILTKYPDQVFPARDARALATCIDMYRTDFTLNPLLFNTRAETAAKIARLYDWSIIRDRYCALWRSL